MSVVGESTNDPGSLIPVKKGCAEDAELGSWLIIDATHVSWMGLNGQQGDQLA